MKPLQLTVDNIAKAIFTVNRHAKTALNPSFLYLLKKKAIEKLLEEGKAKKVGLHFSRNPKYSQQQSDVLVAVGGLGDEGAVWRGLLERGVLVRDVGLPGHLRVTAGTEHETTEFLTALREVLAAQQVQPAQPGQEVPA